MNACSYIVCMFVYTVYSTAQFKLYTRVQVYMHVLAHLTCAKNTWHVHALLRVIWRAHMG